MCLQDITSVAGRSVRMSRSPYKSAASFRYEATSARNRLRLTSSAILFGLRFTCLVEKRAGGLSSVSVEAEHCG
jgi:hypothetical protein